MYYYCAKALSFPEIAEHYCGTTIWIENVNQKGFGFYANVHYQEYDGDILITRCTEKYMVGYIKLIKSEYGIKHKYVAYPFRPAGGIQDKALKDRRKELEQNG